MSRQLSLVFGDEAQKPTPQKRESRQEETVSATTRPVEEIAEELRPRVLEYLRGQPRPVGIHELRSQLGYAALDTETDPQRNPVNRILKELRERGELICNEPEWGEPTFTLLLPSPDAAEIKGNEAAKRAILIAAAGKQPVQIDGPAEQVEPIRQLATSFGIEVCDDPDFRGFTIQVTTPSRCEQETSLAGTSTADLQAALGSMAETEPTNLAPEAETFLAAAIRELSIDQTSQENIRSVAAVIARIDQAQEINVAHIAEAINYHPSVNQPPSSSEEKAFAAAPPLVRPDRQQTFDDEPVEDWPKPKYDPEAITADRPHDGMDGPAHRFVIRTEDNVEVLVSPEESRIGEVLEIDHVRHRVLARFSFDDASEEEWFAVNRVFPTLEEPQRPRRQTTGRSAPETSPEQPIAQPGRVPSAHDSDPQDVESFAEEQQPFTFHEFRGIAERLECGSLTLKELKSEFARLQASREKFVASLKGGRSAAQLKMLAGRFGSFDAKRQTMKQNAEYVYRAILQWFTLSSSIRFDPMSETIEDATARVVEELSEDQFQAYVASQQKEREDHEQAMRDPQTVAQFKIFLIKHDYKELTLEQQARFDQLMATASRERRRQLRSKETVSQVESAGAEGLELTIIEGFHTKKQIPLWICQLSSRVDRDTFKELKRKVKMLDGWYSSFVRGQEGFHFTSNEAAERFRELLAGDVDRCDVLAGRRVRKMESASERLTAIAENLRQEAESVLATDDTRLKNTVRRTEMAAGMRGRAYADQAMAATLRSIAASLAGEQATYLDGVRAKTHIETLVGVLRRAKTDRNTQLMKEHESEGMWERHSTREELDNRPFADEDASFAGYPYPAIYKRHLEEAVSVASNTKGVKQRARRMQSHLVCTEYFVPFVDEHDIAFLQDFINACKSVGIETRWIESGMEDYKRLRAANISTPHELRCALRELVPHLQRKREDDPVRKLEERLIGTKIPGFFPTPKPIIARMLELADIQPGERVLEPSAGKGDILDMVRSHHPDAKPTAVEINRTLIDVIGAKGHDATQQDFLEYHGEHDVVVMNPPFENGQEIEHVRHAFQQLAAGGRLVSVMSAGPFFRSDKKAEEFRTWLEHVGAEIEELPEDAFQGVEAFRQTGVRTRIVSISVRTETVSELARRDSDSHRSCGSCRERANGYRVAQSKRRLPKLPIRIGKAQQQLSQAIICGDHELASWIDKAVITAEVIGSKMEIAALRDRLDEVMEPVHPRSQE